MLPKSLTAHPTVIMKEDVLTVVPDLSDGDFAVLVVDGSLRVSNERHQRLVRSGSIAYIEGDQLYIIGDCPNSEASHHETYLGWVGHYKNWDISCRKVEVEVEINITIKD